MTFFRWRRPTGDAVIDTLIKPPVYRYETADEAVARKTKQRRDVAETIRRRADAVETGAAVSRVLTMTRRS